MPSSNDMPDISSMKLGEIKDELKTYGISSDTFFDKADLIAALEKARKEMPRVSTTYRTPSAPPPSDHASSKVHKPRPTSNSSSSSHSRREQGGGSSKRHEPLTVRQQVTERPSGKLLPVRECSFSIGAPFSFAIRGTSFENDAAVIRVPTGVCLRLCTAAVERKAMEDFLKGTGVYGVSLRMASEENGELLPLWTFDKDRSKNYSINSLGIEVCGPRIIRLAAILERGIESRSTVDVNVIGSVVFDANQLA